MAARRARGQGQLCVKNGAYYGRWRTIDGRRLNRKIGAVRTSGQANGLTKAVAERAFRKLQDVEDHRPPPIRPEERRTVDDVANELRRQLLLDGARKSCRENCESMQRVHISLAIGHMPLEQVTRRDIEDIEAVMLAKGRKPKTVRNVMKFLHGVFEFAVDEDWCGKNPARRNGRRRRRRTRDSNPDLQFLSVAQFEAVIAAIPDEVVQRTPAPTRVGRPGPAPPDVLGPVLRVLIRTAL
jgi:hypothetical protein